MNCRCETLPRICSKCDRVITPEKRITVKGRESECYDCYKAGSKTICVDLDGVLAQYSGWKGPDHIGDPMPGAGDFLDWLNEQGYEIVVHSTRPPDKVISWALKHGFCKGYKIRATNEKVPAMAYIDDRAMCFTGCFADMMLRLKYFRPWWKE